MATGNEDLNKLLSKMQYMYYQTELDGSKVDFKEFIKGLKNVESFKGIINTQTEEKREKGPKRKKKSDSYILIDDGRIRLAVSVKNKILVGKDVLKEIENPDEIRYSRLNQEKVEEILKKAKEAGVLIG